MENKFDRETLTTLLTESKGGNEKSNQKLFEVAYNELKKIARYKLKMVPNSHTLNTTALVHELYLKLFNQDELEIDNQIHFYALCSKVLRQILVDYYRKKSAEKRGGKQKDFTFLDHFASSYPPGDELIDLDKALTKLEKLNKRLCTVTECKFFVAMKDDEIAELLGLTDRTVRNDWQKARMWLSKELKSYRSDFN